MDTLDDKVAVVTGGASGIGLALAAGFAEQGTRVVLADVEVDALAAAHEQLAAKFGDRVHAVVTDVSDLASVEELARATLERYGRVDVVCNNAGVSTFNPLEHQTMDDWHWVIDVNLWGVVHGVHVFLPIMKAQIESGRTGSGHIVNTASLAGLLSGVSHLGPYAVSKAGVVSLSETLRRELDDTGVPIGVSVLCPGLTETNVMEAERNRPHHLGTEQRTAGGEQYRVGMRAGFGGPGSLEPRQVAEQVIDAVRTDRFWVLSHLGYRPVLEARFAEILDAAS